MYLFMLKVISLLPQAVNQYPPNLMFDYEREYYLENT